MKLNRRSIALTSGLVLVLLTVTFPYATYEYSAGSPRGPVLLELERSMHEWENHCMAEQLGWDYYFRGAGFVPCWNAHVPEIQWDIVGMQTLGILGMCGSALAFGRTSRLPVPESEHERSD